MPLRSSNRRRGLMAEINVVPYIDVMLVLVVILMVAAPFVNPSVNKASNAPEKVVEVIVYPDGRMSLRSGKDMKPTDMPGLVAAVREAQAGDPKTPVVIAADKNVRYEEVVNVMKSLQAANVERVGLSLKVERSAAAR